MIQLRPDTRHGHHRGGGPRTLNEEELRAEAHAIRSKRFRSARDAQRLRTIGRQLKSIQFRSPYRHG